MFISKKRGCAEQREEMILKSIGKYRPVLLLITFPSTHCLRPENDDAQVHLIPITNFFEVIIDSSGYEWTYVGSRTRSVNIEVM